MFDNKTNDKDLTIKASNQQIIFAVDEESHKLVQGAIIDFEDSMMKKAFYVVENPVAEKSCSCKVSFSPKNAFL